MWKALATWTAGGILALAALPAYAGPPQSLRDALFHDRLAPGGMAPPPPVARYRLDVGSGFVLDRLDRDDALLKYDGGDEVWALKGVSGAHGDMIFKNDMGEPVLRTTRWGGVTLFSTTAPTGAPAALEGGAVALRIAGPIGPQALIAIMAQSSARARRAAGHAVEFDAPSVPAAVDWLFADAAELAADAFERVAQEGRRVLLARFSSVRFATGANPGVVTEGAIVQITLAPDRGVAGRPSSRRVQMAVARK